MSQEQVSAMGLFDAFKLLDKDLIDKVMALSKLIKVEQLEDGKITRLTIDIVNRVD